MRTSHINKLFKRKAEEIVQKQTEEKQKRDEAEQKEAQRQILLSEQLRANLERVAQNASQLLKRKTEFSDFVQKIGESCILNENRPTYKPKGKAKNGVPVLGIKAKVQELDTTPRYYCVIPIASIKNERGKETTIALDISCEPFRKPDLKEIRVRCGEVTYSAAMPTFNDRIPLLNELLGVLDKLSTPEGFMELFVSTHAHMLWILNRPHSP